MATGMEHRRAAYSASERGLNTYDAEARGQLYREAAKHYENASAQHASEKKAHDAAMDRSSSISMHKLAKSAFADAAKKASYSPDTRGKAAGLKALAKEHAAASKAGAVRTWADKRGKADEPQTPSRKVGAADVARAEAAPKPKGMSSKEHADLASWHRENAKKERVAGNETRAKDHERQAAAHDEYARDEQGRFASK